jgi:hypothetical protein
MYSVLAFMVSPIAAQSSTAHRTHATMARRNYPEPTGLDSDRTGPKRSKPVPNGNQLPAGIKRYHWDNSNYGETEDVYDKVNRDSKTRGGPRY